MYNKCLIWYPDDDLEEPPSGRVGLCQRWLLSDLNAFFHPATQELRVMVTGGYGDAVVRSDEDEAPHRWMEHSGGGRRPAGESRWTDPREI